MTANELNEMVAEKVMGLKNVRPMYGQTVYDMIHTYAMDSKGQETITYQPAPIPDYANDIAAAWQVVEKLITLPYWDGLSLEHVTHDWRLDNGDGWICAQSDSYQRDQGSGEIVAVATTLPRAICLAALEAIGVEVE